MTETGKATTSDKATEDADRANGEPDATKEPTGERQAHENRENESPA